MSRRDPAGPERTGRATPALFIFIVKFLGWVMRAKKEEAAAPPPPTRNQELLTEIRDLLKQPPRATA